jgi:ElaB/YqjD/DUF883 family membrane-anchored ribosome-binding protein
MSLSTTEIENQAEHHRAHISELIDELRTRATPGEVVDQLLGWEDGREIARNFGRQVKDNPMPLAVIGAGIAWLMFSDGMVRRNGGYPGSSVQDGGVTDSTGERFAHAKGYAGDTAEQVKARAGSAANSIKDGSSQVTESASSAMEYSRQTVSDLGDRAQSAYAGAKNAASAANENVTAAADSAWQRATQATQSAAETIKSTSSNLGAAAQEQPLLAAGLGFALGMALGAILPGTNTENSLLGEQSDAVKQRAGELAGEGYEKTKAVAQKSYEAATQAAKDEVQNQGLSARQQNPTQPFDAQNMSRSDAGEPSQTGSDGGDHESGAFSDH